MHLIAFIENRTILFLSDVTTSQDDRETPNVKRREDNGDGNEKDVYVFDFVEKNDKDYNLKNFVTPVKEKIMLLYLKKIKCMKTHSPPSVTYSA